MRLINKVLAALAVVCCFATPALAETAAATDGGTDIGGAAAIISLAVAAAMGALSQSRVLTTALESIGRNPGASGQIFKPMMLGLVFIETLVILTFVAGLLF